MVVSRVMGSEMFLAVGTQCFQASAVMDAGTLVWVMKTNLLELVMR